MKKKKYKQSRIRPKAKMLPVIDRDVGDCCMVGEPHRVRTTLAPQFCQHHIPLTNPKLHDLNVNKHGVEW